MKKLSSLALALTSSILPVMGPVKKKGFAFLSSVPQRRIQEMILAMAQKGHSGKMTDYAELGFGRRTTYGHFLSKGKWDHMTVEAVQRRNSFQSILSVAKSAK